MKQSSYKFRRTHVYIYHLWRTPTPIPKFATSIRTTHFCESEIHRMRISYKKKKKKKKKKKTASAMAGVILIACRHWDSEIWNGILYSKEMLATMLQYIIQLHAGALKVQAFANEKIFLHIFMRIPRTCSARREKKRAVAIWNIFDIYICDIAWVKKNNIKYISDC